MLKLIPLSAIILASCASNPVVVTLPLPAPLELPAVAGSMECLSADTYESLVRRDLLQTERRQTLRAIIETTHD